jgi:hypothetical protein
VERSFFSLWFIFLVEGKLCRTSLTKSNQDCIIKRPPPDLEIEQAAGGYALGKPIRRWEFGSCY